MSNIKVTIVTACYNSELTISRTIESILAQSIHPYEHIIVDGGSTDDTLSIIEGYREQYDAKEIALRVISEPDNGIYDAMNKGIHASSGDIIGLLNSDDYYEKNAMEILLREIESEDADIYMGGIYIHNGSQIIRKYAKYSRRYQTSRNFNHPAMFVTKKAYSEVGDYIVGNVHNDYEWYLRALKMGKKVHIIPEIITNFIIGGASSKKSFKNTLKRIGLKYEVYERNGYSRLYMIECIAQELAKYVLTKQS
ncbi:Glycosyl transferase family 2 [Butyrivibrio proteoclasticus]|uniref:Glycosyl transferase family 2 n=1 Tax=Butyrivibrio proteoclasticus TaxID=43305 RepID=A0A1I5PVY6_9FIRM|nr:glycosyltransferase family 2 protein [Butyrivibrio proteoclasticus]SFP37811.1 Glycosyl transferase family 2 [Butyrivibrio proteoclasticus]